MNVSETTGSFGFNQICGLILFLNALPGLLMNIFVFYKLVTKNGQFNSFLKLCLNKTIPNIIVCSIFVFWVVPVCIYDPEYENINRYVNASLGQLAAWFAYTLGPMTQICMSFNRFYALYFPMQSMKQRTIPITNVAIVVIGIFASSWTIYGLPMMPWLDGECGYVFDPTIVSWRPETDPCAYVIADNMVTMIFCFSITSNSFNLVTFVKLLMNQVVGMSLEENSRRRRRRTIMYVQSVLQDSIHVMDIINATWVWQWSDELWYQFIFLSISFVFIHAFDGFIMFAFNSDMHPEWLKNRNGKTIFVFARSNVSNRSQTSVAVTAGLAQVRN